MKISAEGCARLDDAGAGQPTYDADGKLTVSDGVAWWDAQPWRVAQLKSCQELEWCNRGMWRVAELPAKHELYEAISSFFYSSAKKLSVRTVRLLRCDEWRSAFEN